jgi:peptidoglycan/LPS O-acetylase OafA/YrhL
MLLNVGISFLVPSAHNGRRVFDNFSAGTLASVFVTGNMTGGKIVAFYVLVPISYLLLLSSVLLIVQRYFKQIFNTITLLCFLAILVLYLNGSKSGNLELLTIGLLGISVGHIPMQKINRIVTHPVAVILAYLCYAAAIPIWNSRYPIQVAGVLLTLCLIYLVGTVSGETGQVQKWLILLGKYSLLGYIAQIAILQLLRRSLGVRLPAWESGAAFLAAVILTIVTVEVVDRGRAKSSIVDRTYAAVFL